MESLIETSIEAGAHFRRRGEGRAPVFVSARPDPPRDGSDTAGREASVAGARTRPPSPGDAGDGRRSEARRARRLYRSGRFRELADLAEDLEREARRRGDDRARALARVLAGRAALEQGRLRFARMRFASLGDLVIPPVGGILLHHRAGRVGLGRTVLAEGDPRRARPLFEDALSGRDVREDDPALTAARRGLGDAYAEADCAGSAATEYRRALRRARLHRHRLEAALSLAALVRVEAGHPGAPAEGRLHRRARAAADLTGSPLATIEALRAHAAVWRADGGRPELRRALGDLRKALAVALETGAVLRQARVEEDTAAVLDDLDRFADAEARRASARDLLDRGRV